MNPQIAGEWMFILPKYGISMDFQRFFFTYPQIGQHNCDADHSWEHRKRPGPCPHWMMRWNPMVQRLPTVRHWEVWALEDWSNVDNWDLYRYQKGCYWSSHSAMIRLSEAGVVWKFETPFHFKGQNLILLLKMVTNWGIPWCVPPHFCRSLPRRVGFQRALGSKKTPLLIWIEMWNPWPDSCQAGLGLQLWILRPSQAKKMGL